MGPGWTWLNAPIWISFATFLKTKFKNKYIEIFILEISFSVTSWGGNGIAYWPWTWYAWPWANIIGAFTAAAAAELATCLGLYESVSPFGGDFKLTNQSIRLSIEIIKNEIRFGLLLAL